MQITYCEKKEFSAAELQDLFLSVGWSSGQYPEKLAIAMRHYETVISAWDGDRPVGMICALDDGVMTAYVHYLLVRPDYQGRGIGRQLVERVKEKYRDYLRIVLIAYDSKLNFYRSCGFVAGENETPMFITTLTT